MVCITLGSKTQGRVKNPTQNLEFKIFDPKSSPKPEVLGLGGKPRKTQPDSDQWFKKKSEKND